jgi:Stress up-regulated Nod 19
VSFSSPSWGFRADASSEGHLHDGGVAVDFSINGEYVCSSNALYGGEGFTTHVDGQKWETIAGMTLCPGPIKIKDGDYMVINSRYDQTVHPL